jgi:hypothetical protein
MTSAMAASSGWGRYLEAMALLRPRGAAQVGHQLGGPGVGCDDQYILLPLETVVLFCEEGQSLQNVDWNISVEAPELSRI